MTKATWQEFVDAGMLWWLNRILHTFGWSVVLEAEEDGTVTSAYPARTTWLGFDDKINDEKLAAFKAHIREGK